jgi:hypothetical protein
MLGVALPSWSSFAVFIVKSRRKDKHFFTKQHFFTKKSTEKNTLIMSTHNKNYWCPLKLFFAAEKIRLNPVAEVQPFSLPLFSPQKLSNLNKDEQRYTFYRTAVVWSAD